VALAVLIGGGLLVRLAFLGADSLWLDEAFSVAAVVQHSLGSAWHTSLDPNHPSLYFVVLWIFVHVAGVSETIARLPSALSSIGGLALVFLLARRLGLSQRASVAALLLMAYAPLDVWYAQEARMYAMVTLAALAFAIGVATDSWRGVLLAAIALAVGLYVDFTMVALSAVVIGLWSVRWWYTGRQIDRLAGVVFASIAGWLAFLPEWRHLGQVLGRIDTVPLLVNVNRSVGLHVTPGVPAAVAVVVIATAGAAAAAAVWRALQHQRLKAVWVWLVWIGFVGVTIAFAVPRAYSAKQFLSTGWPFVVLVVAWTLSEARRWMLPVALAVSVVVTIVTIATPRADWRAAVGFLNHRAPRTGAVWLDHPWNTIPYDFYHPALPADVNALASGDPTVGLTKGRDLCLIAERFGSAPPTSSSETWLDAHLKLIETAPLARLEVRCYENP
jgi:uncharacterized membrane protein